VKKSYFLTGTGSSPQDFEVQFIDLVQALDSRGFIFKGELPSKFFISINHNARSYRKFIRNGGDPKNTVLIMLEPRAVYQAQYKKRVQKKYSLVFAPGNPSYGHHQNKFIAWPYQVNENPLNPKPPEDNLYNLMNNSHSKSLFEYTTWVGRSNYMTLIASNKVSCDKFENYSLRRNLAYRLPPNFIQVYGDLWSSSYWEKIKHRIAVLKFALKNFSPLNLKRLYGNLHWQFKSARGHIQDKQILLKDSKFNLVIENDPAYVSEKLIDSLVNGCIPVYLGADVPHSALPKNAYLKLPKTPEGLKSLLEHITEVEIRSILFEIERFVTSQTFVTTWDKKHVYNQIAQIIAEHFGKNE
jgi:hypothetical protein